MGELLKGATVIDLGDGSLVQEDLRIEGGIIAARGPGLASEPGDRVTDLGGRYVMAGLVSAHTHLYASMGWALPTPHPFPKSLLDYLERMTWRLDRALDLESVAIAAQIGATEALRAGVTTVIDHHSSPSCVEGSLAAVRAGVDKVGLRGVLCYEVSDRLGPEVRAAALKETETFLRSSLGRRFRGMVGAYASFALEPETLEAVAGLAKQHRVGVHLHVAETLEDGQQTEKKFDQGVVDRLAKGGALGAKSILAHCIHLVWEELSQAQQSGAWLVHCPRSDMRRAAGYAPAGKFGARKALGTDGLRADALAEGQGAYLRGSEAGFEIDLPRWQAGGQNLAGELFGFPLGRLEQGAAADLVVLDAPADSPLTAETLPGHLALGMGAEHVDAVMVDGVWRLWARQVLSFDEAALRDEAQRAAEGVWKRMKE